MFLRRVVIEASGEVEAIDRRQQHIALRWMEVAGRRIVSQGPLGLPSSLPGREPQRQLEETRKRLEGQRLRGYCAPPVHGLIGRRQRFLIDRKSTRLNSSHQKI